MRVASTEVQNNFGKYLKFAEANEEIIVTKNGRDIARIVPCPPETIRESAEEYRTRGDWVTYEEFMELVENSEQRFELIDGVVYNLASPSYKHQHAVQELLGTFYNWFKGKPCTALTSPFDVTLDKSAFNRCVVQPDVIVICDRENVNEKGRYMGVPTLVVEVLSPSTRSKDMLKKLDLYLQCGIQEYWVVDPAQDVINVYSFQDGDISDCRTFTSLHRTAESAYFEGLKVSMEDVFAG